MLKTTRPIWLLLLLAGAAMAETTTVETQAPSQRFVTGAFDLRPSWVTDQGSVRSENELSIRFRLASNVSAGYVQEFRTNLYNSPVGGLDARLWDGYLKGEANEIWRPAKGVSLSYEPRVYVPTCPDERKAGMVLATRQYLKWQFRVNPQLAFNVFEAPIFAIYSNAGYVEDEEAVANRWFENRLEVGPEVNLFAGRLNVKFPVILQNLRHRDFQPDAKNNDSWTQKVWVYPEATVPITSTSTIGVAYYSDEKGVLQFLYQQSI